MCVASCDVAAGVRLDRVVTPHLDPAVHDAALWLGAPGGASVVTVGGDGSVAVSHLPARAASEDSAFAATAKPDRAAHVVAVCERTGFALVGSRDEDELSVWDLRDERRVRKVRLFAEGGRSSTAGTDSGDGDGVERENRGGGGREEGIGIETRAGEVTRDAK